MVHPLQQSYTLWYTKRSTSRGENYADMVKPIAEIKSLEDFWAVYTHLLKPGSSDNTTVNDYHLFKTGITPFWEDDSNKLGGKWMVRLKKGLVARFWEDLLLAVIGDQFGDVGDELCGIVVSLRQYEDIISVWNRSADKRDEKMKIKETLKHALGFPASTIIEYKNHDQSLKDNSSFRNTEAFK